MTDAVLSPTFLFRFALPLRFRAGVPAAATWDLDEECRLTHFAALAEQKTFADVRAAWSESGLALSVRVEGKRQPPWCRDTRILDSDGLAVWVDTRDTKNIHRAGRFCHHFRFLPTGGGRRLDEPVADQLLVDRARENARPVRPGALVVRSEKRVDGYVLAAGIPAEALTGFDPADHPRLGFAYAVIDRELGIQTLATTTEFPFESDPSLWATLELMR